MSKLVMEDPTIRDLEERIQPVFVVLWEMHGHSMVHGAFSTEEKANEYIRKSCNDDYNPKRKMSVSMHYLDQRNGMEC